MSKPRELPRTVKPRKGNSDFLPIIALSHEDGQVLFERTGEILPLCEFPARLVNEPRSLVIAQNASYVLSWLDEELSYLDSWQYRVTPIIREIHRPESGRKTKVKDCVVSFFGFRRGNGKGQNHYHFPLDPMLWARKGILELVPGDEPRLLKLLQWGQWVREWCNANGLKPSPTAGGLAAQLLKDPRFYPEPRRKVPRATNAKARSALPGNFYELYCDESKTYDAIYLDMSSAHHHCASELTFPNANELVARGHYRVTDETFATGHRMNAWKRPYDRSFKKILEGHGLFLLHLSVPRLTKSKFPPPWARRPGQRLEWVFSNELPTLRELGVSIDAIEAAWTSYTPDEGLNRYAQWALAEIATTPDEQRAWRKPTLLTAYGVLAARPRVQEFGYKQAKGGTSRRYPAGSRTLEVTAKVGKTDFEGSIVNVIHRGMIEAETRKQVLDMSRWLHSYGCNVLSVYADAVFIESGNFPLLPAPWGVKTECRNLKFFSATSFTSSELTKLPGIPAEGVESFLRRLRVRRAASRRSVC